ncbi:Rv0361 family membrane protein, partial [Rhodococcus aetherivorans]|uniref:Rv0361 family membrane protein n=1 Tax=Rhodococcus aetherivorans TaxID=191292 RepID=UPI0035EBBAD8
AQPTRLPPPRPEARRVEPQRIEPQRVQPVPGPQRIDPVAPARRGRRGWAIAALVAGLLVVAAVAAAAVKVYLDDRAANSPEARIRTTVETFVRALAAGDLTTLRTTTCGGLQEFYASVPPEQFADIHRTAVDQGTVPVVTGIDKVQITDGQAIAQVTAHPAGTPTDVTQRTFDLAQEGEDWKVCGE